MASKAVLTPLVQSKVSAQTNSETLKSLIMLRKAAEGLVIDETKTDDNAAAIDMTGYSEKELLLVSIIL